MPTHPNTLEASQRARGRGRHARRRIRRPAFGPAFAAPGNAPLLAGDLPSLTLPEPESARDALVSTGLSVAAHAAVIGAIALSAWLAPELIDDVIPVVIIREAPGSDLEPAPVAPKVLAPRRSVMARPTTPTVVPRAAIAPLQAMAAIVPTQTVAMARIDPAAAPAQVVQQQVASQVVSAFQTAVVISPTAVSVLSMSPVTIATAPIAAPTMAAAGPRVIAPTAAAPVNTPETFAAFREPAPADYSATSALPASEPTAATGFDLQADFAVDTIGSGGGTGGTGISMGTARCLESAYVQRYQFHLRDRVVARWRQDQSIDEVPAGSRVVLRFVLDASGAATQVEVIEASGNLIGNSARRAMRDASPFAAMGDDTRCLAGKRLRATFTLPDAGSRPAS